MKIFFIASLLLLLFTSVSFAALKPGDDAPSFSLRDMNGRDFFLSDVVGPKSKEKANGVILGYFASWCQPCRKEMPLLNKLTDEFATKGVKVVLIDLKDDIETITELLAELKVDKPIVLSDRYGKTAEKYQVRLLPITFFIGRDGKVKDIIFGEIKNEKELWDGAVKLMK